MTFIKNQTGNALGRPPGKKPQPTRKTIESMLERSLPVIEKELETATPEVRRAFFAQLTAALYSNNNG
jgi:hypothetical protein